MKFPSLQTLAEAATKTFKRFPLTVIFLLVAVVVILKRNHITFDDSNHLDVLSKIIFCAYLGMLLSLSVALYVERRRLSVKYIWIGGLATVFLVLGYYFSLPDDWDDFNFRQFALLMIGLHLLIAIAPFLSKNEVNGFWHYNKSLFLRILASVLYSSVFYIGLSLALLAVENLFSVVIHSKWYMDLAVVVFGLFNSLFFFAGIPENIDSLEEKTEYPKGLKIFTQYVLIPLIIIYFAILYAYVFRIVFSGNWPYGWVSYLVLAFAIAGIFSLLLIFPIRKESENKWMLIFSRVFYFALCPLILMLFIAIQRRINAYGITAERYFVYTLACWLTLITLYFILSASKNIKIIPFTLCVIAFGISFGPWGAFSVSRRSQTNRLLELVHSNGMLNANRKIVPASAALRRGDASQIKSIIRYLLDENGYTDHSLQLLFEVNLDSVISRNKEEPRYGHYFESERIAEYMKIDQFDSYDRFRSEHEQLTVNAEQKLLGISGFEYLIPDYQVKQYDNDQIVENNSYSLEGHPVLIKFYRKTETIRIECGGDSTVSLNLRNFASRFSPGPLNKTYSQDSLTLTVENRILFSKIIFKELNLNFGKDSVELRGFNADILLHFKKP